MAGIVPCGARVVLQQQVLCLLVKLVRHPQFVQKPGLGKAQFFRLLRQLGLQGWTAVNEGDKGPTTNIFAYLKEK
jgi:hypothetical protein